MSVNTAKVEGRRKLDYGSFEELLADADRIASGGSKTLGNWSPGQVFQHLALACNGSIDGLNMSFPWPLRMMGKLFKNKLKTMSMPPGFKLPADGAKAVLPAPTSTADGLAALHAAVARLQSDPHRAKHPMLGDLTKDEWDKIHLKHANLHMSFLVPEG